MKKILLVAISILLFHASSYCQSLSLKDLLLLSNKRDKNYVASKSFKLISQKGESEQYVLNAGIDKEEEFWFEYRGVSYWTKDVTYVNALLQQIRKQYKFLVKTKSHGGIIYRFMGRDVDVFVNINQQLHGFSSVSISK